MISPVAALMFRDLGEKYPQGPRRRLKKEFYSSSVEWSYAYKRSVTVWRLTAALPEQICPPHLRSFFGYDPVDIFSLGIADEDDAKRLALSMGVRKEGESDQACNRRARLAWTRISPAMQHVRSVGAAGLWTARYREARWNDPLNDGIWFYASTRAEVEALASLLCPVMGAKPEWRPQVSFMRLGSPEDAFSENSKIVQSRVESIKRDVDTLEKRLLEARAQLERAQEEAGKMMGAVMLGSVQEEEEAAEC